MIDFHCHLDLFSDPISAITAADETGFYVLSVTTTPKAFPQTARLAKGCKRIKTALGLHPEIAHERKSELPLFDLLIAETRYVGEVGLDGGRDYESHMKDQELVFDHILSTCSKVGGRIVSIHSRNAETRVLNALARHPGFGTPVLHWFSGTPSQLRRAVEMGCWFSVGAPMVKTAKGKELISLMPIDKVLTETDAPFTSVLGATYPSADVEAAVQGLASIWGKTPFQTNVLMIENLRRIIKA